MKIATPTVNMDYVQQLADDKTTLTMCDGCVFAEYQKSKEGREYQSGCELQRLEKLEANGATILNVEDKNKEKDFILIKDRICNACRGPAWKDNAIADEVDLNTLLRKETSIRCTFLIYLGPGQSIEDAVFTAKSIQKQELSAKNTIILNNAGILPGDFISNFKDFNLTIPWRMEYFVELRTKDMMYILNGEEEEEKEKLKEYMFFRCIDTGSKKTTTTYYAVFHAGDSIPSNYLSDIDEALNGELIRFLALNPENDSSSGLLMQQKLHETIGGNKERPCIDKVITQTENQECTNLVIPLKKIVKNFNLQ